jgi:hypothetical protein
MMQTGQKMLLLELSWKQMLQHMSRVLQLMQTWQQVMQLMQTWQQVLQLRPQT